MSEIDLAQFIPSLFLHGGPGLNSFAEENLLTPSWTPPQFHPNYPEIQNGITHFWHEPSRFRPSGFPYQSSNAFSHLLQSAEDALVRLTERGNQVRLIAHSFGCNTATFLADKFPEKICALDLIAPAFDLPECFRNIIRLAVLDFEASAQTELAGRLKDVLSTSHTSFNNSGNSGIEEALRTALQDPALLTHYWRHQDSLLLALQHLSRPESQVDFEAFFEVTRDFIENFSEKLLKLRINIPTQIFFGEFDPVVSKPKEIEIAKQLFLNMKTLTIQNASHYVHLDPPGILNRQ